MAGENEATWRLNISLMLADIGYEGKECVWRSRRAQGGRRMGRFVLGFLIGVLAMYWYAAHGDTAVRSLVDWFQDTAAGYGSSPR